MHCLECLGAVGTRPASVVPTASRRFTGSWGCQLRTSTGPAIPRFSVIEPIHSQFYKSYGILPDGTCCCRPSSAALCMATPVVERHLYKTIPGAYITLIVWR